MKPHYKLHRPGECPVPPMAKVGVLLRSYIGIGQYKVTTDNAYALNWGYNLLRNDFHRVIAYRVIED